MAKWYDPFLTKDERKTKQVSSKGITARKREKELGINPGEPKRVATNGASQGSQEKNTKRLQNARQKSAGYGSDIEKSNTRKRIQNAMKR